MTTRQTTTRHTTTVDFTDLEAASLHTAALARYHDILDQHDAADLTAAELSTLARALGKLNTANAGRPVEPTWLRDTVVRVLTAWHHRHEPLDDVDDDPFHAWIVIPAWNPRRALLVQASALWRVAGQPDIAELAGHRFLADLPEPADEPVEAERIVLHHLRPAPDVLTDSAARAM
jgi:hypothetical protein